MGKKIWKLDHLATGRKYHDHTSYGVGDVMYVYEQRLRMWSMYIGMLEQVLKLSVVKFHDTIGKGYCFQQDNAPSRTARQIAV